MDHRRVKRQYFRNYPEWLPLHLTLKFRISIVEECRSTQSPVVSPTPFILRLLPLSHVVRWLGVLFNSFVDDIHVFIKNGPKSLKVHAWLIKVQHSKTCNELSFRGQSGGVWLQEKRTLPGWSSISTSYVFQHDKLFMNPSLSMPYY